MTIKKFFESEEKLAIHCDTEEKAEKLIQRFDQLGYRWIDGSCYTNFGYDRKICFDNKNCWASIDLYKKCNYKILEFEDIDDFMVVEVVRETFKEDPERDWKTFCDISLEEAKRIIQLYNLTKKEPITDWATYIQGFEDGAKMVSEEWQRMIEDTNDKFQRSLGVWTK